MPRTGEWECRAIARAQREFRPIRSVRLRRGDPVGNVWVQASMGGRSRIGM